MAQVIENFLCLGAGLAFCVCWTAPSRGRLLGSTLGRGAVVLGGRGPDLAHPWLLSSPGPDFCINKKSWWTKVRVFSKLGGGGGLWAGGG